MEKYFKFLLILLFISVFFSDWGFFIRGNRPVLSFPEVLVIVFCCIWFLRKLLKKKLKISKESLVFFFLIFGIIISASIGAILNFENIDKTQHFFGILRFLFWGTFLFCFFDLVKEIYQDINFSKKLWKYYLNFSLLIAIIGIFQYIFYFVFGKHLNLNPYFQQHWGVFGGYYRATAIFQEPSFLGVVLVPSFIATLRLFLNKKKYQDLIKILILFFGILFSLSLGSFLVLIVFGFFEACKFLYNEISIFLRKTISRKKAFLIFSLFFILLFFCLIFYYFLAPRVVPRISFEINQIKNYFSSVGNIEYQSGIRRFSSYKGFLLTLQKSPIFGFGFDQKNYIGYLLGNIFETNTGSGIFGFVGTSAGIVGIILIFLIFRLAWNGGFMKRKLKLRKDLESDLLIVGKSIILALLLEQLISYGGILNPDFWIPLAFASLFIKTGYSQIKEMYEKS